MKAKGLPPHAAASSGRMRQPSRSSLHHTSQDMEALPPASREEKTKEGGWRGSCPIDSTAAHLLSLLLASVQAAN